MNAFIQPIATWITDMSVYTNLLAIIALIVCGVAFMIPSEATKKWAQKTLPFILIGVAIIFSANTVANEYVGYFEFTGIESNR